MEIRPFSILITSVSFYITGWVRQKSSRRTEMLLKLLIFVALEQKGRTRQSHRCPLEKLIYSQWQMQIKPLSKPESLLQIIPPVSLLFSTSYFCRFRHRRKGVRTKWPAGNSAAAAGGALPTWCSNRFQDCGCSGAKRFGLFFPSPAQHVHFSREERTRDHFVNGIMSFSFQFSVPV